MDYYSAYRGGKYREVIARKYIRSGEVGRNTLPVHYISGDFAVKDNCISGSHATQGQFRMRMSLNYHIHECTTNNGTAYGIPFIRVSADTLTGQKHHFAGIPNSVRSSYVISCLDSTRRWTLRWLIGGGRLLQLDIAVVITTTRCLIGWWSCAIVSVHWLLVLWSSRVLCCAMTCRGLAESPGSTSVWSISSRSSSSSRDAAVSLVIGAVRSKWEPYLKRKKTRSATKMSTPSRIHRP